MRSIGSIVFLSLTLALALPGAARAADDPRDAELFGTPDDAPGDAIPASQDSRDDTMFGDPKAQDTAPSGLDTDALARMQDDILQVGGQLYLRLAYHVQEDTGISKDALAMPNLLDVYLDARPTDRLRAYIRGRLYYDPATSDSATGGEASPLFGQRDNPNVLLDQLWLKFDIARAVFVTVGQQQLRWGTAHLWNPVDVVHHTRRDPLAFFDERTGVNLLKLHIPVESLGWNFYAIGIFDGASSVDRVGAAGRAEFVFGTTELGLSGAYQRHHAPRFGLDVSAGLGDIDLYAELGVSIGTDAPTYEGAFDLSKFAFPTAVDHDGELIPQAVAGFSWGIQVSDDDVVYLGAEYFYNHIGYDDEKLYPYLLAGGALATTPDLDPAMAATIEPLLPAKGAMQPFYTGRHYAALYIIYPNPGSWESSAINLSTIGNLSDLSFLTRLDVTFTVLTYLHVETYVAVHYGTTGGEFHFAVDIPTTTLPDGTEIPGFSYAPQLIDMGINLRVSI